MQKLQKMSFSSVDLESYPTPPVALPELPGSAIWLDFIKNAYEGWDNSLTLAAGGPQKAILGCLYTLPIFWLYNACRVTGHSAFLIKDIIHKNSGGLSSAPARRLYEATNMLTAPRTFNKLLHKTQLSAFF